MARCWVGSVPLASNDRYRGQAFRIGTRAWGLQFHLEVDAAAVAVFLDAFGPDALRAGTTPGSIADATPVALAALAPHRAQVLGRFARLVGARHQERLVER